MTDTSAEAVERLADEELLAQINCHDPYDVEFARRYRALLAERDQLQAQLEKADRLLRAVDRAKLDQFPTVVTKADAYRKERGEG